jgi:hypothetical protein
MVNGYRCRRCGNASMGTTDTCGRCGSTDLDKNWEPTGDFFSSGVGLLHDRKPINLTEIGDTIRCARDENLLRIAKLVRDELKRRRLTLAED